MKIMIEGLGVLNGEVEYTRVLDVESIDAAIALCRDDFESSKGKVAGTQIKFVGHELGDGSTDI